MSLLNPNDYTVAWIAVLHIEAEAALHILDRVHEGRFPMQRGNDYVFLAGDLGGHNIVIRYRCCGRFSQSSQKLLS